MKINCLMEKKGITLVALIITIIVLLILAGITIGTINGNNSVIGQAENVKESTEIQEEKEILNSAISQAIVKNKKNELTENGLKNNLKDEANVIGDGDTIYVIFNKSKRVYTLNKDGEVLSVDNEFKTAERTFNTQIEDSSIGNDEQKPIEINCIEDLLDLSITVNGIKIVDGDITYINTYNQLVGKYVRLNRDLDFKSQLSYENSKRTDYGDINRDGETKTLMEELTEGKGWLPIGGYGETKNGNGFKGIFYCKDSGKKIKNLYINDTEESSGSGLFGMVADAQVKDLDVTANINCNTEYGGGIIGKCVATKKITIINCNFRGSLKNTNAGGNTGGIISSSSNGSEIRKCKNYATIIGVGSASGSAIGTAGIAGGSGSRNITECENHSPVEGNSKVGGIIGTGSSRLKQCINEGAISGSSNVGGISGYGGVNFEKCYNSGTITATGSKSGGIAGTVLTSNSKMYQCFNGKTGTVNGTSNAAGILGQIYGGGSIYIEQCYNLANITGTTTTAGIVGGVSGDNARILNCYNKGDITGTSIAGIARTAAVKYRPTFKVVSCYNTGTLNATTKSGVVEAGVRKNCYYLSTCGATDSVTTSTSESDLKGLTSTLDTAFTIDDTDNTVTLSDTTQGVWGEDSSNNNGGYPILKWQITNN